MSDSKAVLDLAVQFLKDRGAPATTDNLNRAMLAMRGTDTGSDPYQMDLTGEGTSTSSGPSTRTVSPASADSGQGQRPVRNVPPALRGPIPGTPVASPPRTARAAQATTPVADDLPMPPGPLPPLPTEDAPAAPGIVDRIMEAVTGPATPTVPPEVSPTEGGRPRPKPDGMKLDENDDGTPNYLEGDAAVPAIGSIRNQGRPKPQQSYLDDQARIAPPGGPNAFTEAREQAWQYGEAPDPLGNGEVDPRASGAVNGTVSPLDLIGAAGRLPALAASGVRAVGREIYQRNPANQYGPPAPKPTPAPASTPAPAQATPSAAPTVAGQSPRQRLEALLTERRAASNPPVQVNIPIGGRPPGPVQPVANNPGQAVAPALAREGSENSSGTLEALIRELNTRAPAPSTPYAPPPRPVGTTPSSRGAPRVVDEGNPTAVGQLPGRPGQVPTPSRPNTDAPAGVGTPANPASASTPPKGPPRAVTTPRSEQPTPRMPPPAGGSPMTPTSGPPGGMPSGSGSPYRLESNSGNPTATPATSVAPGGPAVRPGTPQQAGPPAPAGTGGPQYGPPSPQGMTAGQYAQQAARAESAPRMMPQSRPSPGGQLEAVLGEGYGFTAPITNTPQQMAQSEAARRIMELLVRRGVPREQAEQQAIAEVFKRGSH